VLLCNRQGRGCIAGQLRGSLCQVLPDAATCNGAPWAWQPLAACLLTPGSLRAAGRYL
jgi:hypothetical protein